MDNKIEIKENNGNIFCISFQSQMGDVTLEDNTLVIPSPSLRIFCVFYWNSEKVATEISDVLADAFSKCKYFCNLNYSPVLENNNDSYTIELKLNCSLFEPVYSELMSFACGKSNKRTVLHAMDKIIVEFQYFSNCQRIVLEDFVQALEYGFASLCVNLETKFPFVFLYYGRKLFQQSYSWTKKDIMEVLKDTGCSYGELIKKSMVRIHNKVNTTYNTLYIMRILSEKKAKTSKSMVIDQKHIECQRYNDSLKILKDNAYNLQFFRFEGMEHSILKKTKNQQSLLFEPRLISKRRK